MNILTRPLPSLRREAQKPVPRGIDDGDELLPLEPPNICLTGKPELVLELLAALPENLPLDRQRLIIERILQHRAPIDPDVLLGEVVWKKRTLLQTLKHLEDQQTYEQATITAEIEVLWNRREAVQEAFAHQGAALQKCVAELDQLLSFLGEEGADTVPIHEPAPFFNLAA